MPRYIQVCVFFTMLVFVFYGQMSYAIDKTINIINEDVYRTEKDVSKFCSNRNARFTNPSNAGSTLDCFNKTGKLVYLQSYFIFDKGHVTEYYYYGNIQPTYLYKFVRDPELRVSSLIISDEKNKVTILTGDGDPQSYRFYDCYLPILSETASMMDPNGKGLGLSPTKITELLNVIYLSSTENIVGLTNDIFKSAQYREELIAQMRNIMAKNNKVSGKARKGKR